MTRVRTWYLRAEVLLTALPFVAVLPLLVLINSVLAWESPRTVWRDCVNELSEVVRAEWEQASKEGSRG